MAKVTRLPFTMILLLTTACSSAGVTTSKRDAFIPTEVFDLGTLVTEDLPNRNIGKAFMKAFAGGRSNSFELLRWSFKSPAGDLSGTDAFYTLFNHAGAHVDAPSHMSVGSGIDSYRIESFAGPVRVFDASRLKPGRTVPVDWFRGHVDAGDVVLIYTGYKPPLTADEFPVVVTLTQGAAEYLATLPVRAFGTDAAGVESSQETTMGSGATPGSLIAPVHNAFLSRAIPVYEQLNNLNKLVGKPRLFFVGAPINVKDGDGMLVRPVVFAY